VYLESALPGVKKLAGFTKSITPAGVGFRLFEKPYGLEEDSWQHGN